MWCRKCSGYTRENGTKIDELLQAGASRLKRVGTKETAGSLPEEARNCKIEGQKRRVTRKEYRRSWNEFETGGFTAQKDLWNLTRKKMLRDRDALPKEEGDIGR